MYYCGVDPDLHKTALAYFDEDLDWIHLMVLSVPDSLTELRAVVAMEQAFKNDYGPERFHDITVLAVEAQEIYLTGKNKTKNPRDILHLAYVSGIAMTEIEAREKLLLKPQAWKASVPKRIHQARTYRTLGWNYAVTKHKNPADRYCYPTDEHVLKEFPNFNKGDWKHLGDAIGLGLFARKHQMENKR